MKAANVSSNFIRILLRVTILGLMIVMVCSGSACSEEDGYTVPEGYDGSFFVKTVQAKMETYEYDTLEEAKEQADELARYGYQVYLDDGNVVYTTYSELVADILSAGKKITDYVREEGFKYGHAPLNPAINHDAKIVSCDRFVNWALYDAGYTDQPEDNGIYVYDRRKDDHDFETWFKKHDFIKITDVEDLQAGDLVFVFPKMSGVGDMYGAHTFLYAGHDSGDNHFRYDCGSDRRIQSEQPFSEPIVDFFFAYRPVPIKD